MNYEVKDMISKALRDEPPVGVSFDAVLAAGRRRRVRRQFGIVGGAALGVAVVVSSAVLVSHRSAGPALTPASPSVAPPETTGCVVPRDKSAFGVASAEELAESARLTDASAGLTFPLPAGVTMDPAKPRFCVLVKSSFGAEFTLHSPAGDRSLFLEVRPMAGQLSGMCVVPNDIRTRCHNSTLPDGTKIMLTEQPDPGTGTVPTVASVVAWRSDGTYVRVLESGPVIASPAPRILDDKALLTIANAPQVKVNLSIPPPPPVPADGRVGEVPASVVRTGVLPEGMIIELASPDGYRMHADLIDEQGSGNLLVNVTRPYLAEAVGCQRRARCEEIKLPDGRSAVLLHQKEGSVERIVLETLTADHTFVSIMVSNQSEKAQSQRKALPTRSVPPLSVDDLIRLALLPELH